MAKKVERWAICKVYEPFTIGGSVWQSRRFRVAAEDVDLKKRFKGFAFYDKASRWWFVYELQSGGCLGDGKHRQDAIDKANYNICRTPDLRKQIKRLGDTSQHPEIEAADAMRKLANARK